MKKTSFSSGQTLIEMVVATGMVALVLVAIVSGVALGIRNSRFSKNKALATRYGQEAIEGFRLYRDEVGWKPFEEIVTNDGGNPTYCLDVLPASAVDFDALGSGACTNEKILDSSGETEFTRQAQVSLSAGPPEFADLTVTVSWIEGSKSHSIDLTAKLTDWSL